MRMEKKMMVAVALAVMVIISCNTVVVESGPLDCYDACSTACVHPTATQGKGHVATASALSDAVQLIKPMGIWIEVLDPLHCCNNSLGMAACS